MTEAELQKIERGEAQYNYVPVLIAEVRHLRGALAAPSRDRKGEPSMIRQFILRRVAAVMESRPPDFIVGTAEDPYLLRWFLIPRNRWLGVYLHKFLRDDDDEALHDHRYANISYVLDEGYNEIMEDGVHYRHEGALVFRRAATPHRVVLHRSYSGVDPGLHQVQALWHPRPAISLFLCGPRTREWGFHCPKGWIPWHQFIDPTNYGSRSERGQGCP